MCNVGALIIRIGFWGFLVIIIVKYTPNPILIIQAPTSVLLRTSFEGSDPLRVKGLGFRT